MKLKELQKLKVHKVKLEFSNVSKTMSVENFIKLSKFIEDKNLSAENIFDFCDLDLAVEYDENTPFNPKLFKNNFKVYFIYSHGFEVLQFTSEEDEIMVKPEYHGYVILYYKYSIEKDNHSQPIWSNRIASSPDSAYLMALEEKHLGINHKWAEYQLKQLNINW